ncbi:electron transfer flavoprotein subunit beta/FixA family protein [Chloroflexota bacterium]
MNIAVCIKQIMDPEIPMEKFRISNNEVVPPEGIPPVISPYDAQALEIALKLKDQHECNIVAVTYGNPDAADGIRKALAMGADEGVVIDSNSFDRSDSIFTAYLLSRAIKKLGTFDLVLCGREAADWNLGIVGPILAEMLELPIITLAKKVELLNEKAAKVERVIPDGYQIFEVSIPAVLTASEEVGLPRLPSGRGIIKAAQQNIPVWTGDDISPDIPEADGNIKSQLLGLSVLKTERECEFIEGNNATEMASGLADKLRSSGMI